MKDIAKWYYQDGIPFMILFTWMEQKNMVPCWITLYKDLKNNGMTHNRIMHLLNEHIVDSYGKKFRDEVLRVLNLVFS